MISLIGFLVILAPLVIVHELGHLLFAKLFNVRAEAFSVGFGPVLFSKKWGETDFRFSAIPLGGYVKLLGEDQSLDLSEAEKKRALHFQAPWKRFFIFFGGPLFNFLWAILVFMAMLALGEPHLGNVVGRVLHESEAEKIGFRSGDRIEKIDQKSFLKFDDIFKYVSDRPEQVLHFDIVRGGEQKRIQLEAKISSEEGYSIYGELKRVGKLDGLLPVARSTRIGVSDPKSIAAESGLKTGEEILAWGDVRLKDWEEFEKIYKQSQVTGNNQVSVQVRSESGVERKVILTLPVARKSLSEDLGLFSAELFVEKTLPGSPAEKAGIQPFDRIVRVGKTSIDSFFQLREEIQKMGEKDHQVQIVWQNVRGEIIEKTLVPNISNERDPALKKKTQYTIGISPLNTMAEPEVVTERVFNPFRLVYLGTERMLDFTYKNFISIGKMISGQVSVGALGGPILIGKLAGDSLQRGLIDFLRMMAVLSIGLGVLNILPVPVLDGGHLVLLAIETIRGKPLTIRQMEIVQQVGLGLILMLMVVVMKNDLTRLPIFN